MAYLTERKNTGTWEIRESRVTPSGPRSRTLASFRELTPEVIDRAIARSDRTLDGSELVALARRAGAPVARSTADTAAATLLAELARGRAPTPALHRLLVDALGPADRGPTDSERAVAPWIGASAAERGDALRDLLSIADALPPRTSDDRPGFPRLPRAA